MSHHRRNILFKLQAVVLLAVLLVATPAFSGLTSSSVIERLNVTATLNSDGSMKVSQQITFYAPSRLDWPIFTNIRSLEATADGGTIRQANLGRKRAASAIRLTSATRARDWTLTYHATNALIRSNERDQFFLKILQGSGYQIDQFRGTFTLPTTVENSRLSGNIYGISGVTNPTTTVTSSKEISYSTGHVGPRAILTLNAHWPKNVLSLGPLQELRLQLSNLDILPWLGLGILLPLASISVLWRLKRKQRKQEPTVSEVKGNPPSQLSPLIVGTLIDKKIYPKEIVSMLIDLCSRGYIVIVKKNRQYYLSQRKQFSEGLEGWERDIMEQLFPTTSHHLTTNEMKELNKQSLYSPKVRRAFSTIYEVVTEKQFFAENPHQSRVRYKLIALSFYFIGVLGAIWIAVSGVSPFLLLPLAGTMVVCRLIILLTPGLVRYTPMGEQARKDWLAFGNFLAEKKPLSLEAAQNRVFERYLAYAISLGKTVEWANRFDLSRTVIVKPDWFISYGESDTKEFVKEVEAFSHSISEMLTEMRGPLVS